MNIYLDINGVLLANEFSAALYADDFLTHVLTKYPDSTYWLTTHNWRGENRATEVLSPYLKSETVQLLTLIKPTEWLELKTEAINFNADFLWFDDDPQPAELKILEENNATEQLILIDLREDPEILKKLIKVI